MKHESVNPVEPPAPTSIVADGLRNLSDYGYTLHPDFIPPATISALRERIEEQAYMERKLGLAHLGGPGGLSEPLPSVAGDTSDTIFQALHSLPNKGRIFMDLVMHPMTQAYGSGVFGDIPWLLWNQTGFITRKGAKRQHIHIDAYQMPDAMLTLPTVMNVFLCVSDFEREMGPTELVPGSHRAPRPVYNEVLPGEVGIKANYGSGGFERIPAVAKAGTAIIWEGRTWHGQGENESGKPRLSISTTYCMWAFRSGENYPASLHDDVHRSLSVDELRMLGFRTEMAGSMGAFGPRTREDRRTPIDFATHYVPELHKV